MNIHIIFILSSLLLLLTIIKGENNIGISYNFTVYNGSSNGKIKAMENDEIKLKIILNYNNKLESIKNAKILCKMNYLKVAILVNWTDINIELKNGWNITEEFDINILTKRLGGSKLQCALNYNNNNDTNNYQILYQFIVQRYQTLYELIFRIFIILFLIIINLAMGCGLDRQIIIGYLKKPIAPAIGFCCQFIIMPLISFGLAKLTRIDLAFALGLLTIGCSPGGGASNIWSVLLYGELNLSMTMTFISTVAALGMMPLWLFALGRFFVDPKLVQIPYGNIILNLVQIVAPVGIGMLIRYKWEEKAIWFSKKVKIMGLIFVIFVMTFGTYANLYVYKLMGDYLTLLPIGAGLPWLGFILGGIFAFITRRKKSQCITIALETGFQNIGISILILKFSIPQPGGDLGATMPMIVAIFTPIPLFIVLIILLIYRRCCKKKKDDEKVKEIEMDEANIKQKEELLADENNNECIDEKMTSNDDNIA